jgi:phage terminase large subunit-like protein
MTWKYNNQDFTETPKDMEGFVYLITNLTNNKKYIGKKHFWTRQQEEEKRKKVIGKIIWGLAMNLKKM